MSLPQFPNNDPSLSREDVINQIISSIAMEELGLSHIINAEGEKLQYALGTIEGVDGPEEPATIEDLLELNQSIRKTLDSTMMNQFFLKEKLQGALSAAIMQGPEGPEGPQGEDGKSAYELAVEEGFVGTLDEWLESLQGGPAGPEGPEGPKGEDGADGVTPHIDEETGNWFIGELNTGIPAQGSKGEDGKDGVTPTITVGDTTPVPCDQPASVTSREDTGENEVVLDFAIPKGCDGTSIQMLGSYTSMSDFANDDLIGEPGDTWLVEGYLVTWNPETGEWMNLGNLTGPKGEDGEDGADGTDGVTPHIGENGNWFIGELDTGIPAQGPKGENGEDGADGTDGVTPHIGENGNWFIGELDTGIPAQGPKGEDGEDGADGTDGVTPHIGENGNWFIGELDTGIPAQGPAGTTPTFRVEDVISLDPGLDPTVTLSESTTVPDEWLFTFGLPGGWPGEIEVFNGNIPTTPAGANGATFDIPIGNVIFRLRRQISTELRLYFVPVDGQTVTIDYKIFTNYDDAAVFNAYRGDGYVLAGAVSIDASVYSNSNETYFASIRQQNPDDPEKWSLCEVRLFISGNAARTTAWVNWIYRDQTFPSVV